MLPPISIAKHAEIPAEGNIGITSPRLAITDRSEYHISRESSYPSRYRLYIFVAAAVTCTPSVTRRRPILRAIHYRYQWSAPPSQSDCVVTQLQFVNTQTGKPGNSKYVDDMDEAMRDNNTSKWNLDDEESLFKLVDHNSIIPTNQNDENIITNDEDIITAINEDICTVNNNINTGNFTDDENITTNDEDIITTINNICTVDNTINNGNYLVCSEENDKNIVQCSTCDLKSMRLAQYL
ncbi:Uncharacterized protein FWK35_00017417 [Aphis craccivora]|uniref:Uncharacterized protein n=1 Tax=Aphis craccivora TaxID=307492 RepID=A0A6G0Y9R2_APHCR|nr:Uncharacterized protein FWK35_00017417 [Aphis craccivora]